MSSLPNPPFLVKSLYPYESDHPDDLPFQDGQTIRVETIEDEDWFTGSFVDDTTGKSGMFPRNFVEVVPPKTTRRPPPVPPSQPAPVSTEPIKQEEEVTETTPTKEEDKGSSPIEPEPAAADTESITREVENVHIEDKPVEPQSKEPEPEPEPQPQPQQQKPPPPKKKSSAFADRIAAFNNQGDAPPTPLSQQPKQRSFVNKPYVPPPSSYVPSAPPSSSVKQKAAPPPPPPAREIEEEEEATSPVAAGGPPPAIPAAAPPVVEEGAADEEEDGGPKMSLKDRIKMLEQQQKEEQERMDAAAARKKQKAKAKKEAAAATEGEQQQHHDTPEMERTSTGGDSQPPRRSGSIDRGDIRPQEHDLTGDTTGESIEEERGVEDVAQQSHHHHHHPVAGIDSDAPARDTEGGEEEEGDDDDDDDDDDEESGEEDEEEAKRIALRERMAKISGGMGMNLGMILPGAGASPSSGEQKKKKKSSKKQPENREVAEGQEEEATSPLQPTAIPVMPFADPNAIKNLGQRQQSEEDEEQEEEVEAVSAQQPPPPPVPEHRTPDSNDAESRHRRNKSSEDKDISRHVPPPPGAPPVPVKEESSADDEPGRRPPPPPPSQQPPQLPPLDVDSGPVNAPPPPPPRAIRDDVIEDELGDDERTESDDTNRRSVSGIGDSANKKRSSYVGGSGNVPPLPTTSPPHKIPPRASTFDSPMTAHTTREEERERSQSVEPMSPSQAPPPPPPLLQQQQQQRHHTHKHHERDYSDSGITTGYDADEDTDLNTGAASLDEEAVTHNIQASSPDHRPPPPPPPPHPAGQGNTREEDLSDNDEDQSDTTEDERSSPITDRTQKVAPPPPQQQPPNVPPPQQQPLRHSSTGASRSSVEMGGRTSMSRTSVDASRGRASLDGGNGGMVAKDLDLELDNEWWTVAEGVPKSIANNKRDLIYEVEDSQTAKRGGRTLVVRDIYIVYHDYSQTVLTVRFEQHDPVNTVNMEQEHTPPPSLRQDQLEDIYRQYGKIVLDTAVKVSNQPPAGPTEFVPVVISQVPGALKPIGVKSFGAPIYTNLANASVRQFDEIRPGDVVTFRNAKFQGHKGGLHQKYSSEAGKGDSIHVGVVFEWDGTKKKVKVLEQSQDQKNNKIRQESYKLNDLKSGEVKAFRVVGRTYVGWD